MSDHEKRKHTQVMRELLRLDGARVLDIGCGDGSLVRFMTREGARVIGLECGPVQRDRALAAEASGEERYVGGVGEALPFGEDLFDLVIFFNSLHHVPVEHMAGALAEAARVIEPGGRLFVMEPLAEGRYFEIMKAIEDETEVRAKAYEEIQRAIASEAWTPEAERSYAAPFKYASFAQWKASSIAIDPTRRAAIEARESEIEAAFSAAAERDGESYRFWQPSRLNLLRRL